MSHQKQVMITPTSAIHRQYM